MFLNHVFRQEWFNRFPWFVVSLIKNGRTLRKCYICFLVGIKTFEILAYIIGVAGNSRYQWLNLQLFVTSAGWRPRDKGGGGGGVGGLQRIFFRPFWPQFGLKIRRPAPPLDLPLVTYVFLTPVASYLTVTHSAYRTSFPIESTGLQIGIAYLFL